MKNDAQLQRDFWEPSVNAVQIGIEVKEGIVIFAGHVNSYAEMWSAERAAQPVTGVQAPTIEMDTTLSESSQRNDMNIAIRHLEGLLAQFRRVHQVGLEVPRKLENHAVALASGLVASLFR